MSRSAQDCDSGRVVSICRVIRAMRGGSQSRLVECNDGRYYVAKFQGNPQGNRTLVNELVSFKLLKWLEVSTPRIQLLQLPESLHLSGEVFFQQGNKRTPIEGRLHLGSECPVNPERTAIFDFIPTTLLPQVRNLDEFALMFVFDKWLHSIDKRQAIFVRDGRLGNRCTFRAEFIDHGMLLGGTSWELRDAPEHGLPFQKELYRHVDMNSHVRVALERLESMPPSILNAAADDVPKAWLAPREDWHLKTLLTNLDQRRLGLKFMIDRHLAALKL